MSEDEWELPAPREDPEIYKAGLVRDGDGRARLVPEENVVEGEPSDEGGKDGPGCPFSGR
ncbi:MAG TPA: hypothetical protein VFQ67_13825 [Allosphingosinicella sp.]|jgi:hypothetical protein|nr:hypothetical protein [Allosphingosinicella sp.]